MLHFPNRCAVRTKRSTQLGCVAAMPGKGALFRQVSPARVLVKWVRQRPTGGLAASISSMVAARAESSKGLVMSLMSGSSSPGVAGASWA